MKAKILTTIFLILFLSVNAQNITNIPGYFGFDKLDKYGIMFSDTIGTWKLPKIIGNKSVFDFNEFLVKGISDDNYVVLSVAEIKHIAKIGHSKVSYNGNKIRKPSSSPWEKFPPFSSEIVFHDSVSFIIISNGKINLCKSSTLKAKKYFTFYPKVANGASIKNPENCIPIEYAIDSFKIMSNETSLFIAGPTSMIEKFISNKPTISVDTVRFGTHDIPGILITTKIDMNNDGQIDIIKFYEKVEDHITPKGDIGSDSLASMIAVLYKNKWYRTAYRETGQDGIEGF